MAGADVSDEMKQLRVALDTLDRMHMRARTPGARRLIEKKMDDVRSAIAKLDAEEKEAEEWGKSLDEDLARMCGYASAAEADAEVAKFATEIAEYEEYERKRGRR